MPSGSRRPHDRHPDATRRRPHVARRVTRRGGRSRETVLFLIAIALIALHVIDDNFLQPQPGTSAGDHLVSGLVPLALLALAAWAYPRLRGGRRGALALALGVLGIAAGGEALPLRPHVGASGDDFTGLLASPPALLLLGLGVATLWRTRRTDGSRCGATRAARCSASRALVVAAAVVFPIGTGLRRHARGARRRARRTTWASPTRT